MSTRYVLRRLLQVIPSIAAILVITFLVVHLSPGDPISALAGGDADAAYYAALRQQYGLDQPLHTQFVVYARRILSGDLGYSIVLGQPVAELIAQRLWPTAILAGTALIFSSAVGILLGVLAAWRPSGRLDLTVSGATVAAYAVPTFFVAQVAVLLFAVHWPVFPALGTRDVVADLEGVDLVADYAWHLMLPVLVLMTTEVAVLVRLTRAGIIEEMGKPYIRTARAKGLSRSDALTRHALPNALLPVVTIIGGRVGGLLSGVVIIETIFGLPGLGTLLVQAGNTSDYPLLMGLVMVSAATVVLANLLTDLAYVAIDPRIRYR